MNSRTTPSNRFHIPSLDGFRAVAILIVFLSHAGLHRILPGLFGVTVFFFLSGYLITTLLRLETDQTGGLCLRSFYERRILRIFPPFYLALGGIVLLTALGLLEGGIDWSTVVAQAAYLANYQEIFGKGQQLPGTEVLWSLAVEEHFYLLFPLVYLWLRRRAPNPFHQFLILGIFAALVLAWRFTLVYGLDAIHLDPSVSHYPRLCHATDTRLDSLIFGCMLAVYGNPILDPTRFGRRTWLGFGLPLSWAVLLISFTLRDPGFRETLRYTLQGIALFPIFIAAIRFPQWGVFRILNWRPVSFLGVLSYSIYLVHSALICVVRQRLPTVTNLLGWGQVNNPVVEGIIAFALSLGVGILMYYGVDRYCARLRKKRSRIQAPAALHSGVASCSPHPAGTEKLSAPATLLDVPHPRIAVNEGLN